MLEDVMVGLEPLEVVVELFWGTDTLEWLELFVRLTLVLIV